MDNPTYFLIFLGICAIVGACLVPVPAEHDKELYQKVFSECIANTHNAKYCHKAAYTISEIEN